MLPPLVQNRWPGTNPGAIPVPVRATAPVAARFLRAAISAATPASTATAPAATTRRQALTTRLGAPDPLSCAMSPPISRSRPGTQTPPVDGAQPTPENPTASPEAEAGLRPLTGFGYENRRTPGCPAVTHHAQHVRPALVS
jgi:hypothetical protein